MTMAIAVSSACKHLLAQDALRLVVPSHILGIGGRFDAAESTRPKSSNTTSPRLLFWQGDPEAMRIACSTMRYDGVTTSLRS